MNSNKVNFLSLVSGKCLHLSPIWVVLSLLGLCYGTFGVGSIFNIFCSIEIIRNNFPLDYNVVGCQEKLVPVSGWVGGLWVVGLVENITNSAPN